MLPNSMRKMVFSLDMFRYSEIGMMNGEIFLFLNSNHFNEDADLGLNGIVISNRRNSLSWTLILNRTIYRRNHDDTICLKKWSHYIFGFQKWRARKSSIAIKIKDHSYIDLFCLSFWIITYNTFVPVNLDWSLHVKNIAEKSFSLTMSHSNCCMMLISDRVCNSIFIMMWMLS